MGKDILQGLADADVEGNVRPHCRDGAFQLPVIEDNGDGLVADEAAGEIIAVRFSGFRKEVGGYMIGHQRLAQRVGDGLVNLIPGQGFIPGNLEGLADGVPVAHEADEAPGKIRVEGERPQGGTVAGNDDRLAFHNPADDLPGTVLAVDCHGNAPLVIGMAGADNGHGEAFLPVLFHEEVLAGNLVPGIFPVGIGQGGALGDDVAGSRLQVGGGGADVDILPGFAPEQPPVPFHLVLGETDELADRVKGMVPEFVRHGLLIVDIRSDGVYAGGHVRGTVAPVKEPDVPAGCFSQLTDNGHADGSGSADK